MIISVRCWLGLVCVCAIYVFNIGDGGCGIMILYALEFGKWCPYMVGGGRKGLVLLVAAVGDFGWGLGVVGVAGVVGIAGGLVVVGVVGVFALVLTHICWSLWV